MTITVVVREYARLTSSHLATDEVSLDCAQVSESTFDWLCELSGRFNKSGAKLLQIDGRRWLKLDNFVGVLESPEGQVIEILPKYCEENTNLAQARSLLCQIIEASLDLPARETEEASLQLYQAPLSEWIMRRFLAALEQLVKRGLRFDYCRIEEEQRYLRGQLDIPKQMRQPPGREHFFQIRHDVFTADRPENRILKAALGVVSKHTRDTENWRRAHELSIMLHDVPRSAQISQDFRMWRSDRLTAHYQPIRTLCELILHQHMPLAVQGNWRAISFLFPMEKLFERFVHAALREQLQPSVGLVAQRSSQYLCRHDGRNIFQLRPDFEVSLDDHVWILDSKWKLLDAADKEDKYGLSQSDFYQLYAYGQKYVRGHGELILIYPRWSKFNEKTQIGTFEFEVKNSSPLTLHVLPFDLHTKTLLGVTSTSLPVKNFSMTHVVKAA